MFRVIRVFGLAVGLIGGVVAAQGPEFAQQYAQRLGGAIDELRRQIEVLDSDAQATGNTRESAVERLRRNADALVARRGEAVRADIERFKTLDDQKRAIDTAGSPLGRMFVVMRDPDAKLVRNTYMDYTPAVPTTTDGVIAAVVGFLAAWGLWRIVTDVSRSMGRRLRRGRPVVRSV